MQNTMHSRMGDSKSEPFVCLTPKTFSQQDRLENKRYTFDSNMCDQIFDLLLKNNYIRILDHHVKPSIQGRIYCKLTDSFKHSIEDCSMFRQTVKSTITTMEKPSSSLGFMPISSAGNCATSKALRLLFSNSVCGTRYC